VPKSTHESGRMYGAKKHNLLLKSTRLKTNIN